MLHFYDAIPPELWLKILSFLDDFASLYNFSRASTRQRALVSHHSDSLHFNICLKLGYLAQTSFGSSKSIYPNQPPVEILPAADMEALLTAAKSNQKTMIKGVFAGANDWTTFASLKHSINRNWHSGAAKLSVAVLAKSDSPAFWRWKFDPEFNYWATTTKQGGLRIGGTTEVAGQHWKWMSSMTQSYSHLESSGPFLITTTSQDQFLIWRRPDSAFSHTAPTSDGSCGLKQDQMTLDHGAQPSQVGLMHGSPLFQLKSVVHTPERVHCFKARAPYLVAGALATQTMYVWDLETGKLVEEYDVSHRTFPRMHYIELDRHYIFLCGQDSIAVYDRKSRQHVHDFSVNQSEWKYYSMPSEWVAVHHDVQGGHLLALSQDAKLFWTCAYDGEVKTKAGHYVVLDMGEGGGGGNNLCVENGRAVISIQAAMLGQAPIERVFLLNLCRWTSVEEFRAAPPRLVVLLNLVPSFELTTRIEMDSCGVYLSSTGMALERSSALMAHWARINEGWPTTLAASLPSRPPWLDQSGQLICSEPVLSSIEQRSTMGEWIEAAQKWIQCHEQWAENIEESSTAILKLSFTDPVSRDYQDGRLTESWFDDDTIDLSGWR